MSARLMKAVVGLVVAAVLAVAGAAYQAQYLPYDGERSVASSSYLPYD